MRSYIFIGLLVFISCAFNNKTDDNNLYRINSFSVLNEGYFINGLGDFSRLSKLVNEKKFYLDLKEDSLFYFFKIVEKDSLSTQYSEPLFKVDIEGCEDCYMKKSPGCFVRELNKGGLLLGVDIKPYAHKINFNYEFNEVVFSYDFKGTNNFINVFKMKVDSLPNIN